MPVGTLAEQRLVLVRRTEDGFLETPLAGVRFVPLVGEGGWTEAALAQQPAPPPDPDDISLL
jgi:hypothetical protein